MSAQNGSDFPFEPTYIYHDYNEFISALRRVPGGVIGIGGAWARVHKKCSSPELLYSAIREKQIRSWGLSDSMGHEFRLSLADLLRHARMMCWIDTPDAL